MSEQTKDPMIVFKNVKKSVNEAGKTYLALSMSQEETVKLVEALTAQLDNPRGAKLGVHITKKTAQESGRQFDSGIVFVQGIKDPAEVNAGANSKKTFPATATKGFDVKDKVAKAKAALNKTLG